MRYRFEDILYNKKAVGFAKKLHIQPLVYLQELLPVIRIRTVFAEIMFIQQFRLH